MPAGGVYAGMFEQSILLDGPVGRKAGAFFISFTAQIAAAGVLILVPLIYSNALPRVRIPTLALIPLSAPPPIEQVQTSSAPAAAARPDGPRRVFVMPARIQPLPVSSAPVAIDPGAPGIVTSSAAPAFGAVVLPQVKVSPPPAVEAPVAQSPQAPVRVGGDVQAARIVRKVVPKYPPLAVQMRISGTVQLMGVIAKDGTVRELRVVSGHPLLVPAALEAVRQWVYRPTTLNDEPVVVVAPIDVIFTLAR